MKLQEKLPVDFYKRDVLYVAKDLLGKIFVKNEKNFILSGKIVEVEAYDGAVDEAAHSFNGKTNRNEIMFENGGLLYVYFTYGVHFCANIVAGNKDEGKAVLLRAIEPLQGIEKMFSNRYGNRNITEKDKFNLTNGPGKICQAFDICRKHNGIDLAGDHIFILNNKRISEKNVVVTRRIGIKKSIELPWRFYIKDNPYISRK